MKYVKLFFRLLLGAFMVYAGFSHLTFNRQEFVAQVPTWLQFSLKTARVNLSFNYTE